MFIVKIPAIGKTKGCEKAGNAILKILREEIYSNEQNIPIDVSLLDIEEIHVDNSNFKLTNNLIYKNSLEIFETKPKTIFLGGDHSISYSTGKAFLEHCRILGKNPCLIVFDSHANCINSEKEPLNERWLRKLADDGFPSENIMVVGARNSTNDEIKFIREKKIKTISINNFLLDIEDTCDTIMEFASGKELYVSLDINVVDPAFAPGTGYKEVGGLTSRQIIYLMQRIKKMKNLRAVDIVGINPEKDKENLTVKLGAEILSELI